MRFYTNVLLIEDILAISNLFTKSPVINGLNINTYSHNNILIFHFTADCVAL